MSHAPAAMNATLDVIQGLRERGAIPDGDARAYVRQAIAAGVPHSSPPHRAHSPRLWQMAPSAAQYGLGDVDFAAIRTIVASLRLITATLYHPPHKGGLGCDISQQPTHRPPIVLN